MEFAGPETCPLHAEHCCPCRPEKVCADVIFSDLQMPVVKGLDFLEAMSGKGCRCRHIAVLSGFYESEDVARATRLGCKFLTKPFKVKEIKDWLQDVERSSGAERCLHDW